MAPGNNEFEKLLNRRQRRSLFAVLDVIWGCPSKFTSTGGGLRVLVFVRVSLLIVT